METKIVDIEIGHACDAWYLCSNGKTYYEPMYCYDKHVGDNIDTDDFLDVDCI